MPKDLNFAVLVDGENARAATYESILSEINSKGTISIKWVYGDWTSGHMKVWKDLLFATSSVPKQQFHYGKDAVDHAIFMDAIELIYTNNNINAFCIVSSDGGFFSLAQRIREKGYYVIAIGKQCTPAHFRNACHEFICLDDLLAQPLDEDLITDEIPISEHDTALNRFLLKAFKELINDEREGSVYLGDLGTKLKQLDSDFDCHSYGAASLKKLIRNRVLDLEIHDEREDRCFVRLRTA